MVRKRLMVVALVFAIIMPLAVGCNCRGSAGDKSSGVTSDWTEVSIHNLGMKITIPPGYEIWEQPDVNVALDAVNNKNQTWIVVRTAAWDKPTSRPVRVDADLMEMADDGSGGAPMEVASLIVEQLTDYVRKRPENMPGADPPTYWTTIVCKDTALAFNSTSMERDKICYGKERVTVRNNQLIDVLFCSGEGQLSDELKQWADVVLNSIKCDAPL
ncbi:MAG: hypothetical protein P9M14_11740 [Candidatus Alcyoniella australis]|nr:hypothetical protein [Candidatus Alcyoniella australis]